MQCISDLVSRSKVFLSFFWSAGLCGGHKYTWKCLLEIFFLKTFLMSKETFSLVLFYLTNSLNPKDTKFTKTQVRTALRLCLKKEEKKINIIQFKECFLVLWGTNHTPAKLWRQQRFLTCWCSGTLGTHTHTSELKLVQESLSFKTKTLAVNSLLCWG